MGKIIKISKSMNITAREKLVINATEGVEFESSNQIRLNAGEQILYQSSDDIEVFLNDEPLEVESIRVYGDSNIKFQI